MRNHTAAGAHPLTPIKESLRWRRELSLGHLRRGRHPTGASDGAARPPSYTVTKNVHGECIHPLTYAQYFDKHPPRITRRTQQTRCTKARGKGVRSDRLSHPLQLRDRIALFQSDHKRPSVAHDRAPATPSEGPTGQQCAVPMPCRQQERARRHRLAVPRGQGSAA
jgi:hypothetical protein